MASTVNPNTIDTAYPIAGQDNDSQGFRDNFTNIKTNLETVKDEINELHQKAVLKAAITGETLDNDLDGVELKYPTLLNPRLKYVDLATAAATTYIDMSLGSYFRVDLVGGSIALSFPNIPADQTQTSFYIEMNVTAATTVDLGQFGLVMNGEALRYFNTTSNALELPAGNWLYEFITRDQAGNVFVVDHLNSPRRIAVAVPSSAAGAPGDVAGMIASDTDYIYTCIDEYAGNVLDGSFEVGKTYEIVAVGTSDFTTIGAASNAVGVQFVAIGTSAGGDGTADLLIWRRASAAAW